MTLECELARAVGRRSARCIASRVLDKAAPSGPVRKKNRHTLKTQVVIDLETDRILWVAQAPGPTSDLKLFKESGVQVAPEVWCLADSGYQGLQSLHKQTVLPVKKPKGGSLSAEAKHNNGQLAKLRIRVEQVIRSLKVFKIIS